MALMQKSTLRIMDKSISETLTKLENKDNRMQTLNSLAIIKTSYVNQN